MKLSNVQQKKLQDQFTPPKKKNMFFSFPHNHGAVENIAENLKGNDPIAGFAIITWNNPKK